MQQNLPRNYHYCVITVIGIIFMWHLTAIDYKTLQFPSLVKCCSGLRKKQHELPILSGGVTMHMFRYSHWLTGHKEIENLNV